MIREMKRLDQGGLNVMVANKSVPTIVAAPLLIQRAGYHDIDAGCSISFL